MTTTIAQEMMREACQEGLAEGEAKGKRSTLLRLGRKKFGPPSQALMTELNFLNDIDRLDRMTDQLDIFSSWEEVLAVK